MNKVVLDAIARQMPRELTTDPGIKARPQTVKVCLDAWVAGLKVLYEMGYLKTPTTCKHCSGAIFRHEGDPAQCWVHGDIRGLRSCPTNTTAEPEGEESSHT